MTSEITATTAIWGDETLPHLAYLDKFGKALSQQTKPVRLVVSCSENLASHIRHRFEAVAPSVKIVIHELTSRNSRGEIDNLTAAYDRSAALAQDGSDALFMDIDDNHPPDYAEKMADTLRQGADVAVADHRLEGSGKPIDGKPYLHKRFGSETILSSHDIRDGNCVLWSNTAWSARAIQENNYEELPHAAHILTPAGDWLTAKAASEHGMEVVLADTHMGYLQHPGNISGLTVNSHEALSKALNVKMAFLAHCSNGSRLPEASKKEAARMHEQLTRIVCDGDYMRQSLAWQTSQPYQMLWEKAVIPANDL